MDNQRFELIEQIYGTIGQADQWPTISRRIAEITNGAASIFAQRASSQLYEQFSHGYGDDFVESYRAYYGRLNAFVPFVMHQPKGLVVPCTEMLDRSDYERTEFVNDWALPQGWRHYAMSAIDVDADLGVFLAVTRGQDTPSYSDQELQFLSAVMPHIRRAVGLGLRLDGQEKASGVTSEVLGQLGFAAFSMSRAGSVLDMNERGKSLAGAKAGLQVRNGRLHAMETGATERLLRAIRQVADSGMGTSLLIGEGPSVLQATLVPKPRRAVFASAHVTDVLLLIKDKTEVSACDGLRQTFKLTAAETRLLQALASGASLASYCEEASVSRNTVKTQLRSLFAKTGTSRQADLVRLVLSGSARLGADAS